MTRWVLADYGEVISDPMPAETIGELADLAGMQADEFRDRYWKFRPPYDLGQSDRAYWSAVRGHELQAEPQLVEAMVRVDVAGWMTLNPRTLPALIKFGTHAGVRLGPARPGPGHVAGLACGSISHMTELTDVPGAFGYGDSILVGERVRLRGVRDDDLPTLAKWEMDPGRMATLSSWVAPPSEAAAKEHIAKSSANEKDDLGFAIETLDDPPVLAGNILLWGARPKDRCATLGIALGREYIGRGYGTDAMRVIVAYGFREMGLHRIQLSVAPFNPAGIRAYEKAGFVEEGRYRESVLHDGRWYDEVLMSILDHEWAARRSPGR